MRLLAYALRHGWPVPSHLPAAVIEAALDAQDPARLIAAARVAVLADEANLEAGG
jgi:hypothetical protein